MDKSGVLEAKWINLIRECQSSPLTIKEFAQQNKIAAGNLYAWAKRLGLPLRSAAQTKMSFIELGSIQTIVHSTERYSVEMSIRDITIKTEMPMVHIAAFIKELA